MGESLCQKDRIVTHIHFDLCPFKHFSPVVNFGYQSLFGSKVHRNYSYIFFSDSAHDCLLSPTRVASTGCQYYFLFIGRLSKSARGREALDQRSILGHFTELLGMRSDLYLKLVISCLDYSSVEWGSRILLAKALKEGSETCR